MNARETEQKGITLIGMPTSGKSTIGRIVAERLSMEMLDVDRWMEEEAGKPLEQIVREDGKEVAQAMETRRLLARDLGNKVVSTPGSIIYSPVVLPSLRDQTEILWLDVPYPEIKHRLDSDPNPDRRWQIFGIEKGLDTLYEERVPLYREWAKHVIACAGKEVPEIADEIIETVGLTK